MPISKSDTPSDRTRVRSRQDRKPTRSGKNHRPPLRPYPLLEDGQDPGSLPARLAYHLHRLKLTGRPLRDCGFAPGYHASDIAQARVKSDDKDALRLAQALGVDPHELSRPLTAQEDFEWAFYRASATQGGRVWQRAQDAWQAENLTTTQAAAIMRIDRTVVARNVRLGNKRGYRVFPYSAALRLATALHLPAGVMTFLDSA